MTKISETEWKFHPEGASLFTPNQFITATVVGLKINDDKIISWQELSEAFQAAIRSEDVFIESSEDLDEYEPDTEDEYEFEEDC